MKKIKLLLLLMMLTGASAYSQLQQIKIVSFTVKNQLPAVIDSWGNTPGSLLLVAQLPPNVSVRGIRLMVQIKGGGAIICGNNSAGGMQVDEFTTRTFSANELTSTLQGCHDLKEGSYSICVQFYNVDRVAISNEVCKEFSVEAPRDVEYNPPTLINPENGKVFTEAELSRPVTFRWTPLVPKPRDPVTYRLKVWQLMQGQNSTEAMRSNQPIVTKDVDNITQAVVNGIYNGPCKPPYLCDFVWQVQALTREGKPIGKNEGKSDSYTFKVETNTSNTTAPQLVSPNDEKAFTANEMLAPVMFRWTPVVPKPQTVIYRLKVWQLMQGQSGSQAMRNNHPIVTKDVDNITQAVVSGIYTGPCRPPYLCDFVWQVQALDREDHPIGSNEGKSELWSFKVAENGATECSPPKLAEPADAKSFAPKDASGGISFRWTPIVPKPQEPVTYRLKVWQLMQGQNGSQAMRENKPIVEKEMMLTEASISNIYTGPCKLPYLCDFIWQVQALNRQGKPACATNEGKSESWKFSVSENTNPGNGNNPAAMVVSGANAEFKIDSAVCLQKENGLFKYHIWAHYKNQSSSTNSILINDALNFTGCAGNPNPGPQTNLRNNIRVKTGTYNPSLTMTDIIDVTSGTISNIVPLPTVFPALLPPGSNLPFQFDYSTATNTPVQFTFYGLVDDGMKFTCAKNTRNEYDSLKYPKCPCSACDEITINTNLQGNITNNGNGSLSFTALVSATPKKVKRIRAELVYFDMKPDDENCLVCNKNSTYFGNFGNATTTNNNFTASLPFPHSAQFDAVGDIDISGGVPINFTVTIPPMVSCCNANLNFCIRYVITFEDCTVCNKLACYNYKITGCQKQ
jgi:hypothetical protein